MTTAGSVVYVVDDESSVRRALSRLLKSVGLSVVTFASALDFLEHDRPDVPSCLILDVRMPGMTGLTLQEHLISRLSQIPIIFLTGHGTVPMGVTAMKAGAVDFLEKPADERRLLEAIHRALEKDRRARLEKAGRERILDRLTSLAQEEREVLTLLADGLSEARVAQRLERGEEEVAEVKLRGMKKMEASSLADLIRMFDRIRKMTS